jgi:MFS family permease
VQVSSRLYPRFGPRRMLAVGLAGLTATSALFLFVDLETSLWWIRGIMFLRGISMSFAFTAAQAATFSSISSEETGRASSLFNTNRQVAASVGVAVLATRQVDALRLYRRYGFTDCPPFGDYAVLPSSHHPDEHLPRKPVATA